MFMLLNGQTGDNYIFELPSSTLFKYFEVGKTK